MTGLDGTPMPSFTDAMKPDQIWDVVHYIDTLRRLRNKSQRSQAQAEPKAELDQRIEIRLRQFFGPRAMSLFNGAHKRKKRRCYLCNRNTSSV